MQKRKIPVDADLWKGIGFTAFTLFFTWLYGFSGLDGDYRRATSSKKSNIGAFEFDCDQGDTKRCYQVGYRYFTQAIKEKDEFKTGELLHEAGTYLGKGCKREKISEVCSLTGQIFVKLEEFESAAKYFGMGCKKNYPDQCRLEKLTNGCKSFDQESCRKITKEVDLYFRQLLGLGL